MKPVTIQSGAYNGRSPSLASQLARTQRYIERAAKHWAGTDEEYRRWAIDVMAGSLRGLATTLCVQD